jgi:flagellar hook-basal body complex protein FliE
MKDLTIGRPWEPLLGPTGQKGQGTVKKGESFDSVFTRSLQEVNRLQNEANQAIEAMAKGDVQNIHETMIALEKADISFRLMMQVRNKIVEAYQEIMRMQV